MAAPASAANAAPIAAYRETYDWLYDNPEGVKVYAGYGKVSERLAIRIRDEFLPKAALQPDRVLGIDSIMRDAIEYKFLSAPLSREQLEKAYVKFLEVADRKKRVEDQDLISIHESGHSVAAR